MSKGTTPSRRQRRSQLAAMGYLKIKNMYSPLNGPGEAWYDKTRNDGNQAHEAFLNRVQDDIENQLQNDSFWHFIYNSTNPIKYDTRIEYIFDLMKDKSEKNERYYTFNLFLKDFEEAEDSIDVEGKWLEIKKYFLNSWYCT